ncbi:MAG TPA: M48 family metallopeptidase [Gammaproteobacteria bacterium]
MDFFGAQAQARRQTRRLIVLFILAVLAVIGAVYLAVMAIFFTSGEAEHFSLWEPQLLLLIAGGTSLLIGGGSLYKISALASGGGESVAEAMGARQVARATTDPMERRLLNVVDEMAIASGVPPPKVFILDEEPGINAFAAGFSTQQAVVAVTQGCLEQLSRDELQGVIAHEFSHILNGDMRLNLRLIGILHGILLLALLGRVILDHAHGSSRSKNGGGVVFFGLALLVIGYIGVFFGNLIKAAASRQREFLADASAVQFTRNPGGIGGALKKIGGFEQSQIHHPKAEEASHLFFGEGISTLFGWLASHPPIDERIRRIDRSFRGQSGAGAHAVAGGEAGAFAFAGQGAVTITPRQVKESVGTLSPRQVDYAHQLIEALPATLSEAIQRSEGARAVIYALLAVDEREPAQFLQQTLSDESAELISQAVSHVAALVRAGRASWLPLLELALPALEETDGPAVERLLANTKRLIQADGRVTLFEYLVDSLLRTTLRGRPGDKGTIHRYPRKALHEDCRTVISLLAHLGHPQQGDAEAAFTAASHLITEDERWPLPERAILSLGRFDKALSRLATLDYRFRARLIEACSTAIAHDGQVTIQEAELLRIIGAKLDCPIPPLLPNH